MCLLVLHIFSLYSNYLSASKLGFLFSSWSCLYIVDIRSLSDNMICKYTFLFYELPFYFVDDVFGSIKVFNFHEVSFSLVACAFDAIYKNHH